MKVKALFAVKVGNEDWQEELITEQPHLMEKARAWATENGFDRFRVVEFNQNELPDFAGTVGEEK